MNNALQARVLMEAFQQLGASNSRRAVEPAHPQHLRNMIPGMETARNAPSTDLPVHVEAQHQ